MSSLFFAVGSMGRKGLIAISMPEAVTMGEVEAIRDQCQYEIIDTDKRTIAIVSPNQTNVMPWAKAAIEQGRCQCCVLCCWGEHGAEH